MLVPATARSARSRFVPYALVSLAHLVTLAVPFEAAQVPTKALLMPLLAEAAYAAVRGYDKRPAWFSIVLVALVFSWLGDIALTGDDDAAFLGGVGLFLVAQLAYIAVFRGFGDDARTAGRPWLLAPYAVWWVGFLVVFLVVTGPDPMLVAIAAYGVALGLMAYLANRVNPMTAVGAASFLVSDSLIGLSGFAGVDLPLHDVCVMLTYTVGQGLIVAGLLRRHATLVSLDRST